MNTSHIPEFNDGKDPSALRTIGEVANALGIKPHVLRYWEEQFSSLKPVKRSGSRRYYRPEDVALIVKIDRLVHHEGYTLKGAAKVIDGTDIEEPIVALPMAASVQPEVNDGFVVSDEFYDKLAAIRTQLAEGLKAA